MPLQSRVTEYIPLLSAFISVLPTIEGLSYTVSIVSLLGSLSLIRPWLYPKNKQNLFLSACNPENAVTD